MIKVTDRNDIRKISNDSLKKFIEKKTDAMFEEYGISSLDEIGCIVILDSTESNLFDFSEMEFTEILDFKGTAFLHGVKITGDCYGEDIYLNLEVVRC